MYITTLHTFALDAKQDPCKKQTTVRIVDLKWMVIIGMNEYISKEYIRNIALKRWSDSCGAESYAYSRVLEDITDAPTIEIAYGHWIDANGIKKSKCDNCGVEFGRVMVYDCNYCPSCGAQMDGGKNG